MVDETIKKICPACGKPVAGSKRYGSLTGFLFSGAECNCQRSGGPSPPDFSKMPPASRSDGDFCPRCGLRIVSQAKGGSLTGFLFQSTRCKCPPDKDFAGGRMSDKFWKLKEAGSGTTFISAGDKRSQSSIGSRGSAVSIDLAPGATIGGAYHIVELIGRGGMGEVYLAKHLTLGKKCALKVIPPDQVTEMGWQRFQLEARTVAKLDHINLVRVTDLGIHEGCLPFYAMDYVEGKNLTELLAEQGPMPLKAVLEVFAQVCNGVECAHRSGILHRDLKPANIMLITEKSGQKLAKVLDFGLAKLTSQDRAKQSLTAVGDVFGSPFYMSPEQCNGEKLDNRSDIYSLGCAMFECLTGRPPFVGTLASAVIFSQMEADAPTLASALPGRKFPDAIEIVIAKLLRKNPVERYQALSQLKADLELVAAGRDVLPYYAAREIRFPNTKAPAAVSALGRAEQTRQPPYDQNDSNRTEPKGNKLLPPLAISLICLVLITLAGAAIFALKGAPAGKHQAAAPQTKVTSVNLPEAGSAPVKPLDHYEATFREPYFQGVKEIGGKKFRVWDFPAGLSDTLTLENKDKEVWHIYRLPKAEPAHFEIPAGDPLCLHILPGMISHMDVSFGFFGEGFDELDLQYLSLEDVKKIARIFQPWSCITGLRIGNSDWSPESTRGCVEVINGFKFLNALLIGSSIEAESLAKIKCIHTLSDLRLHGYQPHLHDCLKVIAGHNRLKSLTVAHWTTQPGDMELLVNCPGLESVSIGTVACSHEQMQALAKLPHLRQLKVSGPICRSGLVDDLKSLKSLKELYLARLENWPMTQIQNLAQGLKGVQVTNGSHLSVEGVEPFLP